MSNLDNINISIFPLEGKVQNYDWGGKSFIPNLINKKSNNSNFAEYWLGAHLNAPSIIETRAGKISLDLFLNQQPTDNSKLPYLLKVLDVNKMLSIQVHPSKKAAEIGFELENKEGIELTAKNRNYKDKNHKPEVMVALSDFWLLHGFLEKTKLIKNLKNTKELNFLLKTFNEDNYFELYRKVMNLTQKEVNKHLKPLEKRIINKYLNNELDKISPDFWAARAILNQGSINIDKGIFSIYFFNLLHLSKGEAIFQDAGVPHAYLEGKNIELMANSDNVLRGGLTNKHIDVVELLKNTKFEETIPDILKGEKNKLIGEIVYKTKAKDFELSKIELKNSITYNATSNSSEILINLEGNCTVIQGSNSINVTKGKSVFIKKNTNYKIITSKNVELYKASVPK